MYLHRIIKNKKNLLIDLWNNLFNPFGRKIKSNTGSLIEIITKNEVIEFRGLKVNRVYYWNDLSEFCVHLSILHLLKPCQNFGTWILQSEPMIYKIQFQWIWSLPSHLGLSFPWMENIFYKMMQISHNFSVW